MPPTTRGYLTMRKLGQTGFARFRAEEMVRDTCRYIRNEGWDAVRRGDMGHVNKRITTLEVIVGLPAGDRERLRREIHRETDSARKGVRAGAVLVTTLEAADHRRRLRLAS
jgi:hypothetical protein